MRILAEAFLLCRFAKNMHLVTIPSFTDCTKEHLPLLPEVRQTATEVKHETQDTCSYYRSNRRCRTFFGRLHDPYIKALKNGRQGAIPKPAVILYCARILANCCVTAAQRFAAIASKVG
jgi:hypothetical protein